MTVETWPIERIKPYPGNARKIPKAAVDKVAASLREYGWQQPIVVDREGVIIVGHVRRMAALQNGWTDAPVVVATELTAAQCRAYRLADNRSHEEAGWDNSLLGIELADLSALKFDLSLTGFGEAELGRLLPRTDAEPEAQMDKAEELQRKWKVQRGQVWGIGEHRLMCGDSTDSSNVAAVLGGATPLLMVTDPPYGVSLDMEWRDRAGANGLGAAQASYKNDTRADWSQAFELVPSLKVAYVWHASVYTREVLDGLLRIGFLYPQQIIWDKGVAMLTRTHYWYGHEPCWYVRKKNAPWFGVAGESTIWRCASPKFVMGGSTEEKCAHPTQKPAELMRRPIINHKAEEVYEPFLGSGTTMVAAQNLGRRCYGMEIEPKYCAVILERMTAMGLTPKLEAHAKEARRRKTAS